MSRDPPLKFKLMRSWLALDREVLKKHLAGCRKLRVCWTCLSSEHWRFADVYAMHWTWYAPDPASAEWSTLARVKGPKGGRKVSRQTARDHAARQGGFISLKEDGQVVDFVPLTDVQTVEVDGFQGGARRTVYRIQATPLPLGDDSPAMNLDLSRKAFGNYDAKVPEEREGKDVVRMTRHGAAGDVKTAYTFEVVRGVTKSEAKIVGAILEDLKIPF